MTADVPALMARGAGALRGGDNATAIAAYSEAVALSPDLGEAWFNLGWLHRSDRRFDQSLDAYAHAIVAGVERAEEAYLNRAALLSDHLFQPDAARAELHAALALNDRFVPAWISLGMIAEDFGELGDAREAYRRALAIDPGLGRAHARLAALDTLEGRAGEAATALQAALPLAATADAQADMLFALGGAFDAQARYDEAYQAYEAANWFARSDAAVGYDAQAHERLIDRLIACVDIPDQLAPTIGEPKPIFICGLFRSGSTLAEQILGRHPEVVIKGELEIVPALVRSLHAYPEALSTSSPAQWEQLRTTYLTELGPLPANSCAFVDKRCDNYLHIGLIMGMFPHARIVETVRQPLDNLLSAWFLRFGNGVTWAHDLSEAAHHYVHYRRLMDHWHARFPGRIVRFDYDRAVAEPRASIAALLEALALPWDDACLRHDGMTGPIRTASAWQVRQPLHTRSSGRWRHYERHLSEARAILAEAGF